MVVDPSKEDVDTEIQREEEFQKIFSQNLADGKKNLLCRDYIQAIACFQTACSMQSEKYGDTAPECAEAFYYYGKSLLDLARVENNVLGNALKGVPETEESASDNDDQIEKVKDIPAEEKEKLRQDVEDAMATEEEGSTEDENNSDESASKENKEDPGSKEEEGESSTMEDEKSEPDEESENEKKDESNVEQNKDNVECAESSVDTDKEAIPGEDDNQEDPDDVPNMQLAWEMLELAKILYSRKPESKNNNLMVAQCHMMLGDLGLELGDYSQAVGDYFECLTIFKKHLPDLDRRIAEAHFHLGLAYYYNFECDDSLKHYRSSLDVLEKRIDYLNEIIAKNDDDDGKAVIDECTEVGEIKSILPEINAKIEDVLLMMKQNRPTASLGESSSGFPSSSSSPTCTVKSVNEAGSSSSGTATNDISHLVRRKRIMPESELKSEVTSKKAKLEDDSDQNGVETHKNDDISSGVVQKTEG